MKNAKRINKKVLPRTGGIPEKNRGVITMVREGRRKHAKTFLSKTLR